MNLGSGRLTVPSATTNQSNLSTMFKEITDSIRNVIVKELDHRVPAGTKYVFRETDENGNEKIYCDLAVGFPEEDGHFPDVVRVWGCPYDVYVTVRDSYDEHRDISITNFEISLDELSAIADAIISKTAKKMKA